MNEMDVLIDRYCAAWNETDLRRRRTAMTDLWVDDGTYTDPNVHAVGPHALCDHIEQVRSTRPGATVAVTSEIDQHHNLARFRFEVRDGNDDVLVRGLDVVTFDEQTGQLAQIIGFVDQD